MEINISNLGTIKKGKLELGKLTILGGKNNSGKTYVAYSIYGFIKFWRKSVANRFPLEGKVRELIDKRFISFKLSWLYVNLGGEIHELSKQYSESLHDTFNSNKTTFQNCKLEFSNAYVHFATPFSRELIINDSLSIRFSCSKDKILEIELIGEKPYTEANRFKIAYEIYQTISKLFFENYLGNTYIITSERTGIQMFQKELDSHKNDVVEMIKKWETSRDDLDVFLERETARYSLPIRDNINQVRDLSEAYKQTSFLVDKNSKFNLGVERVSGVKFNIDENGRITIASKEGEEEFVIDLHLASSSSRALLGLHTYIKHLAKENELLIIDEPELNLHPTNQIYLARLVAEMVNNGVRILITTHSDFFLKEINNLIALHSDFEGKDKIVKEYDYLEDELLSPEDVRAYICGEGTIREVEVDEFGLTETSFDDAMDMINEISEEIAFHKSSNPVKA